MADTTTRWREVGPLSAADPRDVAGFVVRGRLGEGGMGVVYLAEHPERGLAALKFVHAARATDETFRARFRREVEAANRVGGTRVAEVLAADLDAPTPWLATQFIDGPTLGEAVAEAPLRGEQLVSLAAALADALRAIHAAGVVHRDLKPSNILLTAATPIVIDFGIATARESPALTQTGVTLGTPGWMAPEQVRGKRVGPHTDVFAWGLVLAFAASGRPPFGRGQGDVLAYRVVHQRAAVPPLPAPLDQLVPAALTKDPSRRPPVDHLLAVLTGGTATGVQSANGANAANGATAATATGGALPTVVAKGWGPEALPARDGRTRRVRPEAAEPTALTRHAGPTFWLAGIEHRDGRSLARAIQSEWVDAAQQLFAERNPTWMGELDRFLRARRLDAALAIAQAGVRSQLEVPDAMARFLLALDPAMDPVYAGILLTPEGLATTARRVADGHQGGQRLVEIRDARILRLWRSLPGLEGAAAVDERWRAGCRAFDQLVPQVGREAGYPSPADAQRAYALLLLSSLGPGPQRQVTDELRRAKRSAASEVPWWKALAERAATSESATALAILTAPRAEEAGKAIRHQEREGRKAARQSKREARKAKRAQKARLPGHQHRPVPKAHPSVRRRWLLVVVLGSLLVHLWTVAQVGDRMEPAIRSVGASTMGEALRMWDGIRDFTGIIVILAVALPLVHAAGARLDHGAPAWVIRLYAIGVAVGDAVLGYALCVIALFGVLVSTYAVEPTVPISRQWTAVSAQALFGLVGIVLLVRALWRVPRAVLGGKVSYVPAPTPPPGLPGW